MDEVDKCILSLNQTMRQKPQIASTIGLQDKLTGIKMNYDTSLT